MLTPGIEYFGAASDSDAIAFGEGHRASVSELVRADGLTPTGAFAFVGALLTARPHSELVSPEELVCLSTEPRDDITITVIRLPLQIGSVLADSTDQSIAEIARRARICWRLAPDFDAVLIQVLTDLARAVRAGGGDLYARVLAPTTPREVKPTVWSRLANAAPILGLVSVPAFLAITAAAIVSGGDVVPWLPLIPLVAALVVLYASLGTIRRRRARRRALSVLDDSVGISFPIIAEPGFLRGLWSYLREVLDQQPTRPQNGLHGDLVVDPSGIRVHLGEPTAFIPANRVRGLAAVATRIDVASFDAVGEIAALAIGLRIDDDESIAWIVPLASDDDGAYGFRGSEGFAEYISALLGVPDWTTRAASREAEGVSEGNLPD